MNSSTTGKWLSSFLAQLVMICSWDLRAKLMSMAWEINIQTISIFLLIDEYINID